jgi:hypothetical protein
MSSFNKAALLALAVIAIHPAFGGNKSNASSGVTPACVPNAAPSSTQWIQESSLQWGVSRQTGNRLGAGSNSKLSAPLTVKCNSTSGGQPSSRRQSHPQH